ncbi:MAG TPA: AI-2E family transporter [Mycobacteriales bacterium]|nr:AI-2E family transporter [Mycobacteriales bacterium]
MARPTKAEQFTRQVREVVVAAVLGILALMTLLWVIEQLRALLVLVLFSLFCGFAIEPAVNFFARRGWGRGRATLTVFLGLTVVFGAFGALLGSIVVQQLTDLIKNLPDYAQQVADFLHDKLGVDISGNDIAGSTGTVSQVSKYVLGGALGVGATVATLLFSLLTVATLTFYAAMDGPRLRRAVCSLLPPARQREVLRAWEIAIDRTAAYVYYRVMLAVLSAVVHGVALKLLGVPFAVSLGIWVGLVSQFVPTVGTYIAGIVPVAIALGESPRTALWVLLFIAVYQQIENYVISPPLSARTMKIHPALGFTAAIAGVALIGPLGALLALPVVATVQSFLSAYVPRHEVIDDDMLSDEGGVTGNAEDAKR